LPWTERIIRIIPPLTARTKSTNREKGPREHYYAVGSGPPDKGKNHQPVVPIKKGEEDEGGLEVWRNGFNRKKTNIPQGEGKNKITKT